MAENKVRTEEELLRPEYNYYLAFKIDPEEKDVSRIKQSILPEKRKWTGGKPFYRRYIELWSDIEQVMFYDKGFDPETETYSKSGARAEELSNAKKLKLKEAENLITILAKKRFLCKSELNRIAKASRPWIAVEDLEAIAALQAKQGIRYIDDTQSFCDFYSYEKMEENLVLAKKETVYDVINGTKSDSLEELRKQLWAVDKNRKHTSSPEDTAVGLILGEASKIFKTKESKQKYDVYLDTKKVIWDDLKLRKNYGITAISLEEYLSFKEKTEAICGIKNEEAELFLTAGLKHFGIAVVGNRQVRSKEQETDFRFCPYCGKELRITAED